MDVLNCEKRPRPRPLERSVKRIGASLPLALDPLLDGHPRVTQFSAPSKIKRRCMHGLGGAEFQSLNAQNEAG